MWDVFILSKVLHALGSGTSTLLISVGLP